MEQQEYEREIDLKNLLYYILCRWKLLLAAGLLCMAVLGGYKYVSVGNGQAEEKEEEDSLEMVQDALDGLRDVSTLKGNVLLYYNLLNENKTLDSEIDENRSQLEGSQSQLESLKRQQAEYAQIVQNSPAEDKETQREIKESILAYFISTCEKDKKSAEYMIETLEKKKAENERNAATLAKKLEEEKAAQETGAAINPTTVAVKYGAVGLVGGVFGVAFIICLLYLFSGKLLDASTLNDMHGLRVLAVIPVQDAKQGFGGLIDKLKGTLFQTKEEAYDVIYGRMFNLAGGLKEKTVLVTGAAEESHVQELTECLKKKDSSVKYIVSMNPIENLDALPVFRQADEILLVEQIGKSRLEEIRQELCFIDDVKKRPLGVAVVE